MIESFLITFRETLEAALIIGIIVAYLKRTGNKRHYSYVFFAVVSAIIMSLVSAVALQSLLGSFEGESEEIVEGVLMMIASLLISYLVLWMLKHDNIKSRLHSGVEEALTSSARWGIFFLVFFNIIREGIETVIFLYAASASGTDLLVGGSLGILSAAVLGYAIFRGFEFIGVKNFMRVTAILLVLFASTLFARSFGEFFGEYRGGLFFVLPYVLYIAAMASSYIFFVRRDSKSP